jgi:hypothetical protein
MMHLNAQLVYAQHNHAKTQKRKNAKTQKRKNAKQMKPSI